MVDVQIKTVPPQDLHLAELIGKLDQELLERYPGEEVHGVDFSDPGIHKIVFVVAYAGGLPVGCAGLRPFDGESTELKRFFVDKAYRKHGIGSKILADLEVRAKALGYRSIKLETGEKQPESIGLYQKFGYRRIDRFGEYSCCKSSICYGKQI